jgi:hypothetical protein
MKICCGDDTRVARCERRFQARLELKQMEALNTQVVKKPAPRFAGGDAP